MSLDLRDVWVPALDPRIGWVPKFHATVPLGRNWFFTYAACVEACHHLDLDDRDNEEIFDDDE